MNYLFHLYLCDQKPLLRIGCMVGDFVKGPLDERWPEPLQQGLALHRRLDRFAHDQPAFQRSRNRLAPALRLYRGVIVDLIYDHFLARHWSRFHPLPLRDYAATVYADLRRYAPQLPESFRPLIPRIIAHDWLTSYAEEETFSLVVRRMAGRSPKHARLSLGETALKEHRNELEKDFFAFMRAAQNWLKNEEGMVPPAPS
ncbi:MAG: DUF479 domain-containing protein [Desulfuromonas sp.]|nr:MAG: DUF479 domain-containing protein [Desulfuromonas sp.]